LVELAKRLDTNSTYLSNFINIHTGSNFSQYVNKLRILYIVEKLKSDSKLRAFTIKAIGEGIGFGTTQSFSKAFYHETGIYPSYYLRKLNDN
jgi:AraC-like DNA-binding protein